MADYASPIDPTCLPCCNWSGSAGCWPSRWPSIPTMPSISPTGWCASACWSSPHFPGYPAFIWLARLINLAVDNPARAVQYTSLLGSSLLAPLAATLAVRLWQRPSLLAPVWLLVLALPLTPTLALSGLSDGPALAAWLGTLLALQQRKIALAGLLLGLMLALRPSYFVLALLPFGSGWCKGSATSLYAPHCAGGASLPAVCLAGRWLGLFQRGAPLYRRSLYPVGQHGGGSRRSATELGLYLQRAADPALAPIDGSLAGTATLATLKGSQSNPLPCWTLYWLVLLLWTLFGQNPDNPRHLAPSPCSASSCWQAGCRAEASCQPCWEPCCCCSAPSPAGGASHDPPPGWPSRRARRW